MPITRELITWQVLRDNYIVAGTPIEQPILDEPELRLVYSPNPSRLGMRLRIDQDRIWERSTELQNIVVRTVAISGKSYVEILTDVEELFRPIYALIGDVLSRMADGETDCLHALELSLADFESLIAKTSQMSREMALGLYGELWVLEVLLTKTIASIDCWIGARRESHDFRLRLVELEVKTTATNVREHVIHGLNQLNPTPGHDLFLISLRLASPGVNFGRSLNDLVTAIRARLAASGVELDKFNKSLAQLGYESDQSECSVRYQLAAPSMAISVGADFPAVSHEWLSSSLGSEPASRLRDISLTLNLEGLGTPFDAMQLQ